jgi:hypothetical protein
MKRGFHGTGQRSMQRIVANGGNRLFIKGGKVKVPIAAPHLTALEKALLIATILTPDMPVPPAGDDQAQDLPGPAPKQRRKAAKGGAE